ncbi:MAG: 50S ribosomal protein L18e [Candidatus Woesearchaeota archaeon]
MKQHIHERTKHEALTGLIQELKKASIEQDVKLWKAVAVELERPTRLHRSVNVFKIDANAHDGETVLVPGKVLSMGALNKKLTVAAYKFSAEAQKKINQNGKAVTIQELLKENPKGQNVRIIG